LKKRTKKLLLPASSSSVRHQATVLNETNKSFLVLFVKKELLPSSGRAQTRPEEE
jgi:hypothetical protein